MHRRELLRWLSLIMLGSHSFATANTHSPSRSTSRQRVLIIGAGLAGLAAARQLKQQGVEVLVLEARQRIGGRVWTSHRWADCPVDMGATWIHGVKKNPISDLANTLNAKRIVTRYERAIAFDTQGQEFTQADYKQLDKISTKLYKAIAKAQRAEDDMSIRQAVAALEQEWQDNPQQQRWLNFLLSSEFEHEYSGSVERLSAQNYDSDAAFSGEDVFFPEGFQIIVDYLAQDISIELSQEVTEIRWRQPSVEVMTQKGSFEADQVIITVPLGVLQKNAVQITPELPQDKQMAIQSLGMGVLNKCYMRFPYAFWPDDVDWLGYVSAQQGMWSSWVSFQLALQLPVLLGFNAAERGTKLESLSDDETLASAMQTLRIMFGSDIPDPVDYQITRWATDPFSQGSYSYNAVNASSAMRTTLARPLNQQLYFAGEATSRTYFGTTHGAYLSGVQAAQAVLSHAN